jgi:hypothetical protein
MQAGRGEAKMSKKYRPPKPLHLETGVVRKDAHVTMTMTVGSSPPARVSPPLARLPPPDLVDYWSTTSPCTSSTEALVPKVRFADPPCSGAKPTRLPDDASPSPLPVDESCSPSPSRGCTDGATAVLSADRWIMDDLVREHSASPATPPPFVRHVRHHASEFSNGGPNDGEWREPFMKGSRITANPDESKLEEIDKRFAAHVEARRRLFAWRDFEERLSDILQEIGTQEALPKPPQLTTPPPSSADVTVAVPARPLSAGLTPAAAADVESVELGGQNRDLEAVVVVCPPDSRLAAILALCGGCPTDHGECALTMVAEGEEVLLAEGEEVLVADGDVQAFAPAPATAPFERSPPSPRPDYVKANSATDDDESATAASALRVDCEAELVQHCDNGWQPREMRAIRPGRGSHRRHHSRPRRDEDADARLATKLKQWASRVRIIGDLDLSACGTTRAHMTRDVVCKCHRPTLTTQHRRAGGHVVHALVLPAAEHSSTVASLIVAAIVRDHIASFAEQVIYDVLATAPPPPPPPPLPHESSLTTMLDD